MTSSVVIPNQFMIIRKLSPPSQYIVYIQAHLSCNVDGTHEHLVQVTVQHEVGAVDQRVLKAGPDLQPQLIGNVQRGAQLPEPPGHQPVNLGQKTKQTSAQ